jgi:hypothetical protein
MKDDSIIFEDSNKEYGLPYLIIKTPDINWKSKYILHKNDSISYLESKAYIENKSKITLSFDNIILIFRKQDHDNKNYPTDLNKIDHHKIHSKHKDLPNLDSIDIIKFNLDLKKLENVNTYLLWKHVLDVNQYFPLYIMNKSKHLHQIIEFIAPETILPGELEIFDTTHSNLLYSIGSFDTTYFNKNYNVQIIFPKTNDLHIGYKIDDHVHLFKSRIDIHIKLKIDNKTNVKGFIKVMYPSKKIVTTYPECVTQDDWIHWMIPCKNDKFDISFNITESS